MSAPRTVSPQPAIFRTLSSPSAFSLPLSGSVMRFGAVSKVNTAALAMGKSMQAKPFSAAAGEEKAGLPKKKRNRHNNLYDILFMLDNMGIGWRSDHLLLHQ